MPCQQWINWFIYSTTRVSVFLYKLTNIYIVLTILKTSPALQQLLPELAWFFATEARKCLENILNGDVSILISFATSIMTNRHVQIHYHVHQFMIPLIEIMLGPDIGNVSMVYPRLRLRRLAASVCCLYFNYHINN